jgi:uncharacterized membrane protein (UPF0182 family)
MSNITYAQTPRHIARRRIFILAGVLALILLIIFIRAIATVITSYWWFESVGESSVFIKNLETKIFLVLAFWVIMAAMLWLSIVVANSISISKADLSFEDEVVIRYYQFFIPRKNLITGLISGILGLFVGFNAYSQWQNWLLFSHAQSFYKSDGQFKMDAGYFVFKLPFLSWLSGWVFVALVIVFIVTALTYYLNGGIRIQARAFPTVEPRVKAHLSLILALIAIEKALSYYFISRPMLDLSTVGVVQGASYTEVHVQLPAVILLTFISIASALIFIGNIFRRGWALPITAIVLWAVIALIAGVIWPAVFQKIRVQPAQSTLEIPYIERNIQATRYAMGINNVRVVPFNGSQTASESNILASTPSLDDVKLWNLEYTNTTYDKFQDIRNFYQFSTLAYDRYDVNGVQTPVVIGVREINPNDLPSQTWVNLHLQYTHGYGVIMSPANAADSNGNPTFLIKDMPVTSSPGLPKIKQPAVYFGVGETGYVVADTSQAEFDYENQSGNPVESHYAGSAGVPIGGLFSRLMYSIYFGDLNLLTSGLVGSNSKIIYYQDIRQRINQVAPFLSLDSDPYPVIANGQIYWVQDAYTTSNMYPYSQEVTPNSPNALSPSSGLPDEFNYIRNSVKVVVNAYTGKMTFYAFDPNDPILKAWESIYPNLFTPLKNMNPEIKKHLRYPEDLLAVQAGVYGRYHITNPSSFYNASDAWVVSQAPSSAPPSGNSIQAFLPINPGGKYSPEYEEVAFPGQSEPGFDLIEPFVPVSSATGSNSRQQILSALLVADCNEENYGKLTAYVTPSGTPVNGPAMVSSLIDANANVSKTITLLSQQGSAVTLGIVAIVPIGQSVLYLRPMYVSSSTNPIPTLKYVIAVYGNNVTLEPTLAGALSDVFNQPVINVGGNPGSLGGNSTNPVIEQLINQASADYQQAQNDLKSGNLGAYQSDVNNIGNILSEIQNLEKPASGGKTPTTSTAPTSPNST